MAETSLILDRKKYQKNIMENAFNIFQSLLNKETQVKILSSLENRNIENNEKLKDHFTNNNFIEIINKIESEKRAKLEKTEIINYPSKGIVKEKIIYKSVIYWSYNDYLWIKSHSIYDALKGINRENGNIYQNIFYWVENLENGICDLEKIEKLIKNGLGPIYLEDYNGRWVCCNKNLMDEVIIDNLKETYKLEYLCEKKWKQMVLENQFVNGELKVCNIEYKKSQVRIENKDGKEISKRRYRIQINGLITRKMKENLKKLLGNEEITISL